MKREYYFCCCLLDNKKFYFIWYWDEEDGVFLDSGGKFPLFDNFEKLTIYANKHKLSIKEETIAYFDLEKVEKLLKHKIFQVDCIGFLNTWNLFSDISRSIGANFNSERKNTKKIYEKLFWGNNLPAVTPEGLLPLFQKTPRFRHLQRCLSGDELHSSLALRLLKMRSSHCVFNWTP